MKDATKAKLLELAEGIFGWVWILTIPVWLWFLVRALFFEGSWAPFFVWFAVAWVSKNMLLRGFLEHKRTVMARMGLERESERPVRP